MRPRNPGERPPHAEYNDTGAFMNRIQLATITDVNEERGTCTLSFDATPGERQNVALPFYLHIGKKGQRGKSAWRREMPQPGDVVKVGFDSNSTARIIGYDTIGYDQLASIQESEGKFGFRDLKMGEFDQKSSGGAYLKGDVNGTLFLAGGMSSLTLDRKNYEARINSGVVKESLGTSTFRRGLVKRTPIPFQPEQPAKAGVGVLPFDKMGPAAAVLGDLYEFTADIRAAINPSSPLAQKVALFSLGNVMDPLFSLPVVGDAYAAATTFGIMKFKINPTANARLLLRIYDSVPVADTPIGTEGPLGGTLARPFELGVDQMGNTFINLAPTALMGFNVWSPIFASITSQMIALSGMVYLGGTPTGPAPILNFPVAQPNPVICGTLFGTALTAFATAMTAACTACSAGTPAEAVALAKGIQTAVTTFASAYWGTLSQSVFVSPLPAAVAVIPASFHPL